MNLGWIRELFTLSEIERGRVKETTPDPRRIEPFQDLEAVISTSLAPPIVQTKTTSRILNDRAEPKTVSQTATARSLPDQELLKKLLQHRPNYTSNRILRTGKPEGTG